MKDLVPIENPNPVALFANGGLTEILARIEQEARSLVPDTSTAKGRKAIASAAANVARSKTYLDGLGKDFVARIKAQSATVDAERRAMRDRLDGLRDEIRRPLTEWERIEAERQAEIAARLAELSLPTDVSATNSSVIAARIAELRAVAIDETWGDSIAAAAQAKDASLFRLTEWLAVAETREAEQAKTEQERLEREAQARREHDERIAREAAEQATREANARAAAEREATERAAKAEREAAERAAKAAEIKAEAERQASERARLEAVKAQQDAERRAIEADARAAAAVQAERARAEAEQQRAQDDADARAADKQHKAQIHRDILAALVGLNLTEEQGKAVITAIAQGGIPRLVITY